MFRLAPTPGGVMHVTMLDGAVDECVHAPPGIGAAPYRDELKAMETGTLVGPGGFCGPVPQPKLEPLIVSVCEVSRWVGGYGD